MKACFLILLIFWSSKDSFAQKNAIDSNVYAKWAVLGNQPRISNNGKFVTYDLNIGAVDVKETKQILMSTETGWKIEIGEGIFGYRKEFTPDSKHCVFIMNDNLVIINLLRKTIKYISDVSDFNIPARGSGEWMVYQKKNNKNTVVLRNLKTGIEKIFPVCVFGKINEDGTMFVSQKGTIQGNKDEQHIEWLNLTSGVVIPVWKGQEADNLVVDFKNNQLAFKVNDSIWYYKLNIKTPVCLASMNALNSVPKLRIRELTKFNEEGNCLYASLVKVSPNNTLIAKNAPEIWSYKDAKLQSVQEKELPSNETSYLSVIRLTDKKVIQLQKYKDESLLLNDNPNICLSSYAKNGGDYSELWWNSAARLNYDLVNIQTGERSPLAFLADNGAHDGNPMISPGGGYVLYYHVNEKKYVSYEVSTGKAYDLTKEIRTSWLVHHPTAKWHARGIAAWLSNDKGVLIYDSYDIWKLDLSGKTPPQNITNFYGYKHNTVFTLALIDQPTVINEKEPLLFSVFDLKTKNNGFFNKRIGESGDPLKLTMGAYLYKINTRYTNFDFDFVPLKAKDTKTYLVKRQSAVEAPNFFLTKDFKTFTKLTNQEPQKDYNWFTTELHTWKSLDGNSLQGILYKPDSFNPNNKYPVIFYYYERLSDGLNSFLTPRYNQGRIDIPTYVSKGYLVFCPDIYYVKGDPMQGTYNALISAAKYLSTMPFVNRQKMGLQGHSFGAIQTNFLLTRTNIFAAACSASGSGNWISAYGTLNENGASWMGQYEDNGQNQMGNSLWANLPGYIKNSPVLQAHEVTTPLLLMHTKLDNTNCTYANIMEFFLGLRRLGKKAWMVVYPEESHVLFGKEEMADFTIRTEQFFDHYLKDKPAPLWMLDGVRAKDRAFGSGLVLDSTGRTPGNGLLTAEQQREVDSLMIREPVDIKLK